MTSWASEDTYKYYQFTNPLSEGAITITVTPFSGDPDLYVSTSTPTPTMQDYEWSAMAYGADHITLDYTVDGYVIGEYYIGVYAWTNTSFTITVTQTDLSQVDTADGQTTTLFDGTPQTGLLTHPDDMHYYSFHVGDSGSLSVSVTPLYGDPDVYITNDGTTPSPTNYQWDSLNWGRDSVSIDDCSNCDYLIGVNAFSHTLYTILASSSTGASLLSSGLSLSLSPLFLTFMLFL